MKLNFKDWKKVSATPDSTTFRNSVGHTLNVSHKPLSAKMREHISALPMADGGEVAEKMADGGEAGRSDAEKGATESWFGAAKAILAPTEEPKPKSTPPPHVMYGGATYGKGPKHVPQEYADGGEVPSIDDNGVLSPDEQDKIDIEKERMAQGFVAPPPAPASTGGVSATWEPDPNAPPAQPAASIPPPPMPTEQAPAAQAAAPQPGAPQAPGAIPDPYGANATYEYQTKGIQDQLKGIAGQAGAAAQQAKAQESIYANRVKAQEAVQQDFNKHAAELKEENDAFLQDYKEGHIDPNHYLGSKSTGGRIASAIGLILSGIGSGLTGKSNMAADYINKQIEHDIDAQKAELGKKENLLSANMKRFGNLRDATDMTRIMMNSITADKLGQAAATAGSQAAAAAALKAKGELKLQSANIVGQSAMRKAILSGNDAGHIAPELKIRAYASNPAQQEALSKDLQQAQNTAKARDNVLSGFDQLKQLTSIGNRIANPIQSGKQIEAVHSLLAGLSKETAGKFTEQDSAYLAKLLPAGGDSKETESLKRARLEQLLDEKMNFPSLKGIGIDPMSFGRYNAGGQSRFHESAPVHKK